MEQWPPLCQAAVGASYTTTGDANPEQVELATLEYIDWWNNRRLHTEIGDIPPAEKEAMYYAEGARGEMEMSLKQ